MSHSSELYTVEGKFNMKRFKACYHCHALHQDKYARKTCPTCNQSVGFTPNYEGVFILNHASKSWVAKFEGYTKPGWYALSVAKPPKDRQPNAHDGEDEEEEDGYEEDDEMFESREKKRGRGEVKRSIIEDSDDDDDVLRDEPIAVKKRIDSDDDEESIINIPTAAKRHIVDDDDDDGYGSVAQQQQQQQQQEQVKQEIPSEEAVPVKEETEKQ